MWISFAPNYRALDILSISILSPTVIFNYAFLGYDFKNILASQQYIKSFVEKQI